MQQFLASIRRSHFLLPLFVAIVAVPVLVFPWFVDAYEVHKATCAIVTALFAGMFFPARALRERSVSLFWSWAFFPLLAFFLATLLSASFSVSSPASWLGLGGGDYASVLFIGSCVLISFLLGQAPESFSSFVRGVRAFWGGEVLVMIGLLTLLSFGLFSFPAALSLGTPHALAFFLGVVTLLFVGEISEGSVQPVTKVFGAFLLAALFVVAFLLDAWVLWLPLFVVGIVLLSFTLSKARGTVGMSRVLPATFLVIIPLVGWFLPPLFQGIFPAEIVPSFSLSFDIVKNIWSTGFGFFVGSGPGTYGISYALHALPTVNSTLFWNVIFERGFSYVLTIATTGGVFTLLSFMGIQISGIVVGFRAWARAERDDRGSILGVYLAFIFLSVSAWTYAWNTPLVFLMFVLFGLLLAAAPHRQRTWSFASSPHVSVFASFGFVTSLVVLSLVFFVTGTRYAAEIAYAQALALQKHGAELDEVLVKVNQAASFNRWNDLYYRELSLLLLQRINSLVAAQAPAEQVQAVLSAAVNAAVRASEIGPHVVANWDVRGNMYREVAPAVANAADFSISSFATAIQLAPNNPLYAVGLGRAYLTKADLLAQIAQTEDEALKTEVTAAKMDALSRAEESLLHAVALKADYTAARYFLSVVYERQDKLADAVKSMEVVRALTPEDVGVGMQLSLLYLRQGKNDLAKAELERIIVLSPTYANARWYLSVLLEQEGDIDGAIAQIIEVIKTNPDNEAVQQRLARLQSGEVADDAAELPDPLPEEALVGDGTVLE
ncbi:MAG: tetratricopeptide repeat protein [Patescibacteria group bacterium]